MSHAYKVTGDPAAMFAAQVATFGFTSSHEGKALGLLLAEGTAEGIRERSIERQCDGDGNAWPENSDEPPGRGYLSQKLRHYGVGLTNVRTGQMLSIASLMGTVIVTQYLVTIVYGTGEAPTSSSTGYFDRLADGAVTDDDKAMIAHESGRKFFQLDETIKDSNFVMFSEALGAHMANPGR